MLSEVAKMIPNALTTQLVLHNSNMTNAISRAIFQNQTWGTQYQVNPLIRFSFLFPQKKTRYTTIIITPTKKLQQESILILEGKTTLRQK